jgi:uncharacterized membrane protein
VQLVVLQRTAENKYLRLHVDDAHELAGGFPKSREELFAYRGLVIGSMEASAFTGDQLRMIADFVDRRGGGLLMLGGPKAFGEGGYAGTPVADALPVVLPAARDAAKGQLTFLSVSPTRAGAGNAITQLAATDRESTDRWAKLPQLSSVNTITGVKPGATVLLNGSAARGGSQIVLASQRYGRGKAMAFAVQDSWLWQFHASMPVEDQTHETFWRQLLRWLVADVPDRVTVTTADRVEPSDPVTVAAEVLDAGYMPVNSAQVRATATSPTGRTSEIRLQWTGERDGDYRGTFVAEEAGTYEIKADASDRTTTLGSGTTRLVAGPDAAEAFNAALQAPTLRRIAETTGGRYYTPQTMARLPEDLQYTERGVTVLEERDLWDMPALLALLVACVLGEWSYRRARNLA